MNEQSQESPLTHHRLLIVSGAYGSGKTEVSVNLALQLREHFPSFTIADLDIVNPYFRTREAIQLLEEKGVKVVVPRGEQFYAELPIILPEIKGIIQNSEQRAIFDVGGDDVGARMLGSFRTYFRPDDFEFAMVINSQRPFTRTVEGAVRILNEIQAASGMKVTSLICNSHLMDHTTQDVLDRGYELTRVVADQLALDFLFMAIEQEAEKKVDTTRYDVPILRMQRLMLPPWNEGAVQYGKAQGRVQI